METKTKTAHTPTPWEVHEDWNKTVELFGGDPPDKFKNITNILSWEDAAFIVKAVNCHEELLEALKLAYDFIATTKVIPGTPVVQIILDAIAKAEGK